MTFPIHADAPPLFEDDDGVVRVNGTRIPLERIVGAFLTGSTPEQIAQDYDVLSVEDVYAVINYFLHHREDVNAYLAKAEGEVKKTREAVENMFDPTGVRARLLARRPAEAS